jgi:hypothetical protein
MKACKKCNFIFNKRAKHVSNIVSLDDFHLLNIIISCTKTYKCLNLNPIKVYFILLSPFHFYGQNHSLIKN